MTEEIKQEMAKRQELFEKEKSILGDLFIFNETYNAFLVENGMLKELKDIKEFKIKYGFLEPSETNL